MNKTSLPATDRGILEVIRVIATKPRLSQRELAAAVGMSLGKVNYCVRALIEKGFVKVENYRNSDNKLAYLYVLTPTGLTARAELTRGFIARKVAEYEALRQEIEKLQRDEVASVPLHPDCEKTSPLATKRSS